MATSGSRATIGITPLIPGAMALFPSQCLSFIRQTLLHSRTTSKTARKLPNFFVFDNWSRVPNFFVVCQVEGQSCLQDIPIQSSGIDQIKIARLGARTRQLVNKRALAGPFRSNFTHLQLYPALTPNAPADHPWRLHRTAREIQNSRASKSRRNEILWGCLPAPSRRQAEWEQ